MWMRRSMVAAVVVFSAAGALTLTGPAPAARAEVGAWDRVSVGDAGEPGDDESLRPTVSADGQVIAFVTVATTLLPGLDGQRHVLVRDRSTGVLRPAGLAADGTTLGWSDNPTLSADGRWLAFCGSGPGGTTAYLRDLTAGVTTRLGAAAWFGQESCAAPPSVTAHGEKVAFARCGCRSSADRPFVAEIVVWDRATGRSRMAADSGGDAPLLSRLRLADGGRILAYDAGEVSHITVLDLTTGERIFETRGAGPDPFVVAEDGGTLVYRWTDPSGREPARVMERDLRTGTETRLDALDPGYRGWALTMSPDGRFVAVSPPTAGVPSRSGRVWDRSTATVLTAPDWIQDLSDATGTGPTAVVATAEPWLPEDTNGVTDVYAARLVPDGPPLRFSIGPDTIVAEGAVVTVPITLSRPTGEKLTVGWRPVDGTARGSLDFGPDGGEVVFWPGRTTATISVATLDDTVYEGVETFAVELHGPRGATVARSTATIGIVDDDPPPTLGVSDPTAFEGYTGTTTDLVFTVRLSRRSGLPVTVTARTADDTARAARGDYTPVLATVTIPAGADRATVTVPVLGDDRRERNERFRLVLGQATGATIEDAVGVGTIVNDD